MAHTPNESNGFPQAPQGGFNDGAQGAGQAPVAPAANGYGTNPAVAAAPKQHGLSVKLLIASLVLSLIANLVGLMGIDGAVDEAIRQNPEANVNRETFKSSLMVGAIIGLVLGLLINGLFVFFWAKGHGWARIVLTILAAFSLFGLFGTFANFAAMPIPSILSILTAIVFIAGVVIAWNKEITAWLQARKAAKF
ncbi:hypothetical protein [Falsarthrobacter nasiphocae]|uniref:Uncharacterized membrane protein YciS (DUF1049 family) n=1 Tax=Falsarthrobacter nasiphocae TaxID=189863 RepID=A0AAE3YF54_9MICC|nr:hypothetical protein [Falsarthrobacter nasiphocae]MDR6892095.1 uncharacterized membrane protein YciS (DUF1049 family) [Falsarthrobacter nasiphocae]